MGIWNQGRVVSFLDRLPLSITDDREFNDGHVLDYPTFFLYVFHFSNVKKTSEEIAGVKEMGSRAQGEKLSFNASRDIL